MNILGAKINWYPGYANSPELEIIVDDIPKREDLRYRRQVTPDGTAYFAQHGDYVDYFWHNPKNERGYGGAVFNVILITGEQVSVKGPWSSNSQSMNMFFPRSVSVTISIKSQGYRLAGHLLEAKAIELIQSVGAEICYLPDYGNDNECSESNPYRIVGIKQKGMTFAQSQRNKPRQ